MAFVGEFAQQRRALDQDLVRDDDGFRPPQGAAHQRLDEAPQPFVRDDIGVPMHHQRTLAAEAEREDEIGERKGGVQREQVVIGHPPPQPPRVGRCCRQRQQIAERAHALDRDVIYDDLRLAPGFGADQCASGEAVFQPCADVADDGQRAAEQIGIIDLEDVQYRRPVALSLALGLKRDHGEPCSAHWIRSAAMNGIASVARNKALLTTTGSIGSRAVRRVRGA
jgi:hypothetical protein